MPTFLDAYISETDLARQLDLTVSGLRGWAKRDFGPTRQKLGRKIYYRRDEVADFLRQCLSA